MKMIENWWRDMWRLASIRLGMIASAAIAWMAAYPDDWRHVVEQLPPRWRPAVGAVAFLVIAWSRMAKQGAKNG